MEDKYDTLKLKNQLCYPLYLCSKEIIRKYSKYLDDINLTYTQYIVMMYFWEIKSSNLKSISNTLCIDSSTLTPLLRKLENKGYITREKSTNDERELTICITNKGESLKDKALNIPEKIKSCIDINDSEIESLYKIIYKILLNLEKTSGNMSR